MVDFKKQKSLVFRPGRIRLDENDLSKLALAVKSFASENDDGFNIKINSADG